MQFYQHIILNLLLIISIVNSNPLKLVFSFVSSGAYNPKHNTLNSAALKNLQSGELNALGQRQSYLLGQKFRNLYINKKHFNPPLPSTYNHTHYIFRGVDYNNTLQSASSFTLGLYPLGTGPKVDPSEVSNKYVLQPALQDDQLDFDYKETNDFSIEQGYAPVTVHSELLSKDQTLLGYKQDACYKVKQNTQDNQERDEYEKEFKNYSSLIKEIEELKIVKSKIDNFEKLYKVGSDIISLYYSKQTEYSEKIPQLLISKLQHMKSIYLSLAVFRDDKKQTNLYAKELVGEMMRYLKKTKDESEEKLQADPLKQWYQYVSEEELIFMLLRILGVNNHKECLKSKNPLENKDKKTCVQNFPIFSSSLLIEYDNVERVLQFMYNGQYLKGVCTEKLDYCTFDKFLEKLQKIYDSTEKSFDDECQNPVKIVKVYDEESKSETPVIVYIVLGVMLLQILFFVFKIIQMIKKIKRQEYINDEYQNGNAALNQELVA